ncbi:MAG: hypothetical protein AAB879_03875 [Patescibacteria group bacterium]
MPVNTKRMAGAGVRTKSGIVVGKFVSADLDGDTGKLAAVRVAPRGVVSGLLAKELVIGWQSIVSMTETEIIVTDAWATSTASRFATSFGVAAHSVRTHLTES